MAEPTSKAQMDPNYEGRLRELAEHAAAEEAARRLGNQVKWFRPAVWTGDLSDWEGLSVPFSRESANQACLAAIKDPTAPGVVGDIIAATTMIDYLASQETALRARLFMRGTRAMAHAAARKRGHGDPGGVFLQNGLEYVRGLLAQAKAKE